MLGWVGRDVWHAHCVKLDDAGIALFARTGTGVAHCPCSNMRLASGIAPVRRLRDAGVNVGLGVDGSASNDGAHAARRGAAGALAAACRARAGGDDRTRGARARDAGRRGRARSRRHRRARAGHGRRLCRVRPLVGSGSRARSPIPSRRSSSARRRPSHGASSTDASWFARGGSRRSTCRPISSGTIGSRVNSPPSDPADFGRIAAFVRLEGRYMSHCLMDCRVRSSRLAATAAAAQVKVGLDGLGDRADDGHRDPAAEHRDAAADTDRRRDGRIHPARRRRRHDARRAEREEAPAGAERRRADRPVDHAERARDPRSRRRGQGAADGDGRHRRASSSRWTRSGAGCSRRRRTTT